MNINENLVEKYLIGTSSAEEAKIVLDWLETEEGQAWLAARFDHDVKEMNRLMDDSFTSVQLSDDEPAMKQKATTIRYMHHRAASPSMSVWLAVATIACLVASLTLLQVFFGNTTQPAEPVSSVVYSTGQEEHRIISLRDGTRIRLNENSSIEVPETWNPKFRAVQLKGEAFFEVTSDTSRPFIVGAGEAEVRVLGTAFSIKASSRSGNMIVAVSEGSVSLGGKEELADERQVLEKDMVGLLNLETFEVTAERTDVTNYVNWMHGRVVFEFTPFSQVLRQLSHIYDIENDIEDEELLNLRLTADFSEHSLDNVLETISHSLNIDMKRNGDMVRWSRAEANE